MRELGTEEPKQDYLPLEKRAVLNREWHCITHTSRFPKAGDYITFQLLHFRIFLVKSKITGQINAFHNVCRHRAYPVVTKEQGSTIVLGCRYHGWTYDTEGQLKKAPKFDKFPEFSMESNPLFKIQTWTSPEGLVFVNLDQIKKSTTPEYASLGDLDDFKFARAWTETTDENWKELSFGDWKVTEHTEKGWFSSSTNKTLACFPLSAVQTTGTWWCSRRLNPVSDNETQIVYELYVKNGAREPEEVKFGEPAGVANDIKELCEMHAATETTGPVDPSKIVQNVESLELDVYCKSTCDEVLAW